MKLETIILRGKRSAFPDLVAEPGSVELAAAPADAGPSANDVRVEVAETTAQERQDLLAQDSDVIDYAPSMPVELIRPLDIEAEATGPVPSVSWGVEAVGALESRRSGAGVTVAILDTGIKRDHPAFRGLALDPGDIKNFTADPDGEDTDGHGTHCAGTIFGQDVDNKRIGVARGVTRALIGKVIGKRGGSTQAIYEAMLWAQQNGAHIISMSLGMDFPGYQRRLTDKFGLPAEKATSLALAGYRANIRLFDRISQLAAGQDGVVAGSVVIAAAGNESKRPQYTITVSPPAAAVLFLSVGALRRTNEASRPYDVAPFSNDGPNLAAPGVDIWSANHSGGLTAKSGTSMAAPHVAGIAALWAEQLVAERLFHSSKVIDLIKAETRALPGLAAVDVGIGLVQAPIGQ